MIEPLREIVQVAQFSSSPHLGLKETRAHQILGQVDVILIKNPQSPSPCSFMIPKIRQSREIKCAS